MKIVSIVGARPQFIKLAPLSTALKGLHHEIIVHTGQHYDYAMSEKIFLDLGIREPDFHLNTGAGSQISQICEMLVNIEKILTDVKPHAVIVFGDTNSTLAGAMAAAKLYIPIIHIEAGLRSYNRTMPEEINRIATDHVSKYLFAPTQTAVNILVKEGLQENTFLTGDIMVDTMKNNLDIALNKSTIIHDLHLENKPFSLLTLHRNYNVDDVTILENILMQLGQLDETVLFPVHPRTKKMLSPNFTIPGNIKITEPLGYLDFITLESFSNKIITDSGGIQKEAYILKKPCITLRTETEWIETVEEKWNLLINPTDRMMVSKISTFTPPKEQNEIFGKNVAEIMVSKINSIN